MSVGATMPIGVVDHGFEHPEGLDPGIEPVVFILIDNGIETFESCQGGDGHHGGQGGWPVVRFFGQRGEGFKALSIALNYDLPVFALHRVWTLSDGEPTGPQWELVFHPDRLRDWLSRRAAEASVQVTYLDRGIVTTAPIPDERWETGTAPVDNTWAGRVEVT